MLQELLNSQLDTSKYNIYDYKRSRSNTPNAEPSCLDLAYLDLHNCEQNLMLSIETKEHEQILDLFLNNNLLKQIPPVISYFINIETLDLSSNCLKLLDEDICKLLNIKNLIVKDNLLEDTSLPKDLKMLTKLEVVNFSGNLFTQFPYQLLELTSAKEIYLGTNKLQTLPRAFNELINLEVLYLGGNQIKTIPDELCQLKNLTSLNLSSNQISYLPSSMAKLKMIRNLALHGNNLTTLPIELLKLNLKEISLRSNPLVNRFAKEFSYNVPSLLELSGRVIKMKSIPFCDKVLPNSLVQYLNSAQCCLNPKCKGVYFTSKVEHVKFVDFCGKYRVPLLQYLCSSSCNEKVVNGKKVIDETRISQSSGSDSEDQIEDKLLKKILLG
jgi:Leucine-rich repeat (LRR) protein